MSGPELRIVRSKDGVAVVDLRGEHDEYEAPWLEHEIESLLGEGADVVVDLGAATFLGAANVEVLLASSAQAKERGRRVVIALPEETGADVRRLVELTHIELYIPVFPSRASAIRSARERRAGGERRTRVGTPPGDERRSGDDRRAARY